MKTRCPYCQKKFKAPDTYAGKQAKCPSCRQSFVVAAYQPTPVVTPEKIENVKKETVKAAKNNIFINAWKKSPLAFKTGFLTTIGVISALMVAGYTYRFSFLGSHGRSEIESYCKSLESHNLFRDGVTPYTSIFRGRRLTCAGFVPDANRAIPKLELWLDDRERVVGIAIMWYADAFGWPADIDESVAHIETYSRQYNHNFQLSRRTIDCFEAFTGFRMRDMETLEFEKVSTRGIANHQKGKWRLEFTRSPAPFLKNKSEFVELNKKSTDLPLDEKVWLFSATAQSW